MSLSRPSNKRGVYRIPNHSLGAFICLLGSFTIYLFTLAPTVQGFDSAELTVGAYTLGFVHPTGYPLYLLLGNLFSHLPIGNIGQRLNLMSAVFASLSVWMLFELLYLQSQNWILSVGSSFIFASSAFFWSQSVRAEVYTLNLFLILSTLYTWQYAHKYGQLRIIPVCFLLLGLGMGNHLTISLLWISILLIALFEAPKWRRYVFGASLIGILVASGLYLYFPWREKTTLAIDYIQPYFGVNMGSPAGILWLVSGQAFHCSFGISLNPPALVRELARLVEFLWTGLLGFGLILAAIGWGKVEEDQPLWNHLLSIYFSINLIAFISYHVVDKEAMFIPALAIAIVWILIGIKEMLRRVAIYFPRLSPVQIQGLAVFGILLPIIASVWLDWRNVNLRNNDKTINFARQVLSTAEPGTIVINHWVTASVFDYLRVVEKERQDVISFNLDFFWLGLQKNCETAGEDRDQLMWFQWMENHASQNPLCFIEPLPPIPSQYQWVKNGPCWNIIS